MTKNARTDESGWTHITKGPPPKRSHATRPSSLVVPPTQIARGQQKYDRLWRESECRRSLQGLLEQRPSRVGQCVCLGLGSLSDGREASKHQMATLDWLLGFFDLSVVYMQDPIFSQSDEAYFRSRRFTVVSSPQGFDLVDHQTLLFAPHLERNVYALALASQVPALSISGGVQSFLEADPVFQSFDAATTSCPMPAYDRDMWPFCTWIYWRDS